MWVNLQCKTCGKHDCPLSRLYIPEGSLEGCTRKVSELEYIKYNHYMMEVLPFILKRKDVFDVLNEIEDFLTTIENRPLGHLIDSRGKITYDTCRTRTKRDVKTY